MNLQQKNISYINSKILGNKKNQRNNSYARRLLKVNYFIFNRMNSKKIFIKRFYSEKIPTLFKGKSWHNLNKAQKINYLNRKLINLLKLQSNFKKQSTILKRKFHLKYQLKTIQSLILKAIKLDKLDLRIKRLKDKIIKL